MADEDIPVNPDTDPPGTTPEEMAAEDAQQVEEAAVRMRCLELAHQREPVGGVGAEDRMFSAAQNMFMFARYSLLPQDTRPLTADELDGSL